MHEVLVYRLGGLSLPKKSVVRLTDRPDMTLDVYRGRKTTMQQLICVCTVDSGPSILLLRTFTVHAMASDKSDAKDPLPNFTKVSQRPEEANVPVFFFFWH